MRWSTVVVVLALLLSACGPSRKTSDSKRYSLKGKVVSVDKQSQVVNVDAETIPGFMDAMTMPYKVKPESILERLSPGDVITADLIVYPGEYWLENLTVVQHLSPPSAKVTKVTALPVRPGTVP